MVHILSYIRTRRARSMASAAVFMMAAASCSAGKADEADEVERLDLCQYALAFADEFDTLSVAPRKLDDGVRWIAHTAWNGDFGDAIFSDPRPDWPFTVKDGILRITAFRDEEGRWRSGLLSAADETGAGQGVRYGYFEARMKMPPGEGTWPAFWLMSLQPASQRPKTEIDVIEYYGHMTDRYFVAGHVWRGKGKNGNNKPFGSKVFVPDGSLVEDFHRFGVSVDPERITYFFDGEAQWSHPTPVEHTAPLYPLVNLALGSGYSIENTPDPSTLEVDYVRVYRPLAEGEAGSCTGEESAETP